MSNVTPITGNGLSNVLSEFGEFTLSGIEKIKGGNSGSPDSDFTDEHLYI